MKGARHVREKKEKHVGRMVGRVFAVIGLYLGSAIALLLGAITVVCLGPSVQARDLFVNTVMETSAAKFLAYMYFSEEEIAAIRAKNGVVDTGAVTAPDTSFVPPVEETPADAIEIEDVTGATFKGKMMIVHDPSRVTVGTLPAYDGRPGKTLDALVKDNGAIAGINAGGFEDEGGMGNGGTPLGIVIHEGRLLYGSPGTTSTVIGFDTSNRLIVGKMSAQQALDRHIRDAVSFGPLYVVNGEAVPVAGTGGGLNPRTAIGQRADGAVLLLVIDGRQSHSLGATYKDCQQVMLDYGAVNAANLDGGSSTLMIYEGEHVNMCATLYGSRDMPTSFLVK